MKKYGKNIGQITYKKPKGTSKCLGLTDNYKHQCATLDYSHEMYQNIQNSSKIVVNMIFITDASH